MRNITLYSVSTTPLRQWGFRQCLPFSGTTLRGKHWWPPIAVMGVVDTFRQDCRADIEKVLIFVEQLYNCTIEREHLS